MGRFAIGYICYTREDWPKYFKWGKVCDKFWKQRPHILKIPSIFQTPPKIIDGRSRIPKTKIRITIEEIQ